MVQQILREAYINLTDSSLTLKHVRYFIGDINVGVCERGHFKQLKKTKYFYVLVPNEFVSHLGYSRLSASISPRSTAARNNGPHGNGLRCGTFKIKAFVNSSLFMT